MNTTQGSQPIDVNVKNWDEQNKKVELTDWPSGTAKVSVENWQDDKNAKPVNVQNWPDDIENPPTYRPSDKINIVIGCLALITTIIAAFLACQANRLSKQSIQLSDSSLTQSRIANDIGRSAKAAADASAVAADKAAQAAASASNQVKEIEKLASVNNKLERQIYFMNQSYLKAQDEIKHQEEADSSIVMNALKAVMDTFRLDNTRYYIVLCQKPDSLEFFANQLKSKLTQVNNQLAPCFYFNRFLYKYPLLRAGIEMYQDFVYSEKQNLVDVDGMEIKVACAHFSVTSYMYDQWYQIIKKNKTRQGTLDSLSNEIQSARKQMNP